MKWYWSYKSVPELDAFSPGTRKEVWDECRMAVARTRPLYWLMSLAAGAIGGLGPVYLAPRVAISPGWLDLVVCIAVALLIQVVVWTTIHQIQCRMSLDVLRLRLPGRCRDCGYDLTGNQSGVCPECGTATGGRAEPSAAAAATVADSRAPDDGPVA